MLKKFFTIFLFTGFLIVLSVSSSAAYVGNENVSYYDAVPGDVIVVFKQNNQTGRSAKDNVRAQENRIKSFASSMQADVTKVYPSLSLSSGNKFFALLHSDVKSEKQLLKELQARPEVLGASLNYKIYALDVPDDPYYSQLWGIKAIQADKIWADGLTGDSEIYVAVMDTGVSYTHEDLADNFETDGYSKNFTTSSSYNDVKGHGSHVSGTIAGVGNNGKGVVGINWKAKIIALKVLSDNGSGQWSWELEAFDYLSGLLDEHPEMNLAAVNLSLGGYSYDTPKGMIENNDPMWLAFSEFSKKNRAVICVAAGNETVEVGKPVPADGYYNGKNLKKGMYCYPASLISVDNMIVVAAADNDSTYSQAYYSNYSTEFVDVAAPGSYVYSTVPTDSYASYSGTSMATPHVTGAAALLKSIFPEATAEEIKAAIKEGANSDYATSYSVNGFLDIYSALSALETQMDAPPQISTQSPIKKGYKNEEYETYLTARGVKPLTWTLTKGSLPAGLKLSSDGKISGTPTKNGTFKFTVKVTNANGSDSKELSIFISNGEPEFINTVLPSGNIQSMYSATISTKSSSDVTYTVASGSTLPPYLTLSADGTISGAPSKLGTYSFAVTATNEAGSTTETLTLKITGIAPLILTFSHFPSAVVSKDYKLQLESMGTAPVTWSLSNGYSLPEGLNLDASTGIISGVPAKAGYYSFYIYATNEEGSTSCYCYLYVDETNSDIEITTETLPTVYYDVPYNVQLEAKGTTPVTWSLEEGSLPSGITLSESGLISGTAKPYSNSSTTLKVKATNSKGSVSKHIELRYSYNSRPHKIAVEKFPDGVVGESYNEYVRTLGGSGAKFEVMEGELPPGLILSSSGYINGTPLKTGSYTFKIRESYSSYGGYGWYDIKEFTMTIVNAPKAPVITTTTLPEGAVGTYYNAAIGYSGTKATFSYIYSLPSGIYQDYNSGYTGILYGTPSVAGEYTITATVQNSLGSDTKTLKLVIKSSLEAPKITTTSLTKGTINTPYEFQLLASGAGLTWKLKSGELPEGMYLSESGKIYGTPTQAGTFKIKVEASNAAGEATKDLTLQINGIGSPKITFTFPKGSVTGGTPNYKWSISSGALPDGMKLSYPGDGSEISIAGTPKKAGSFTFTLKVTDANKKTATKKITVSITLPMIVEDNFPQNITIKNPYTGSTRVVSGKSPYTWTQTGTLPPGLTVKKSGAKVTVKGNPTKAGKYTFTLKVTDSYGAVASEKYSVTVKNLTLGNFTANGSVNKSYNSSVSVTGGTANYSWSYSGKLPTGVKITYSGAKATLKGTPTKAGEYTFTLKVTDKYKATVSKTYTITVTAPELTGNFPLSVVKGNSYNGNAVVEGGTSPYIWSVEGKLPDGLTFKPAVNKSTTTTKATLTGKPTKAGTYNFTVKVADKNGATASASYKVKVSQTSVIWNVPTSGVQGASYKGTAEVYGGTSPYTWSVTGTLPNGLKFTPELNKASTTTTATISGKPTKAGTFTFTVKATDKNKVAVSKKFTVKVTKTTLSLSTNPTQAALSKTFNITATVSGGTSAYTWSTSGTIPTGTKFTSSGTTASISGTPTKAGSFTFRIKVLDKNKVEASKQFTVKIVKTSKLTMSGSFTAATVGSSYNRTITASGGLAPYNWSLVGSLPSGLSFSYSGAKAVIKGTPKNEGTTKFSLVIKDNSGDSLTKQFSIKVNGASTSSKDKETESKKNADRSRDISSEFLTPFAEALETDEKIGHEIFITDLSVISTDILEQGTGKDSDIITVQADKSVTFVIGDWVEIDGTPVKISDSDVEIYIDDKLAENIKVSEGVFVIPSELVQYDFKVKAQVQTSQDNELESTELFISVEN